MRHMHECLKLPKVVKLDMVRCVKIDMSNEESYTVKEGDLVAIQFVKDDNKILVRRGRIKDIVVINDRATTDGCKTNGIPNVSHIVLDCSEQFTVKLIEIRFVDIIKIGGIDDEFEDYSDRITKLEPNFMEGNKCPVREGGLVTKEEAKSQKKHNHSKGIPIMKA